MRCKAITIAVLHRTIGARNFRQRIYLESVRIILHKYSSNTRYILKTYSYI